MLSHLFYLDAAVDICVRFLIKKLDDDNCLDVLTLASEQHCKELIEAGVRYLSQHHMTKKREFNYIGRQTLLAIINSENLCEEEEEIYEAVIGWIRHDDDRRVDIFELISPIRLQLLDRGFFVGTVLKERLITSDPDCRRYIEAVEKGSESQMHHTRPRLPILESGCILLSGGAFDYFVENEDTSSWPDVMRYDTGTKMWSHSAQRQYPGKLAVLHGRLVYSVSQGTVECYDAVNEQWIKMKKYENSHEIGGVGVVKSTVYMVRRKGAACELCEDFKFTAPLPGSRSGYSVAALEDSLYAIGGELDDVDDDYKEVTARVDRYDVNIGKWVRVSDMTTGRGRPGIAVSQGCLYAFGGCVQDTRGICPDFEAEGEKHRSVEKYVPKEDRWVRVCDMQERRGASAVAVCDGLIYVMGGCSAMEIGPEKAHTMEIYNPKSDSWTLSNIPACAARFGADAAGHQ